MKSLLTLLATLLFLAAPSAVFAALPSMVGTWDIHATAADSVVCNTVWTRRK